MSMPYFSIITPTYNRSHIIGKTIESVLGQKFDNFEYIIVDDGSTDNTEKVVLSFNDTRIRYFKKKNEERGVARNFGISKALGKYVCFLDSDDIYYPNHLSEAYEFIMNNEKTPFFYQPFEIQLPDGSKRKKKGFENKNVLTKIAKNNFLCPIGAFIETDIAKKHPFNTDPKFNIAEDLYLWLILAIRYDILFTKSYTSCLVSHDGRTMENIDPKKLEYCTGKLVRLLKDDQEFGKHRRLISYVHSSHLSLCALYYSIEAEKLKALHFLMKSLLLSFTSVFRKRTFVIIRNLIVKQ